MTSHDEEQLSDPKASVRKPGPQSTALCLSGGGYRAMVFHVGTLWRLNDAGMLPKIDLISSVSGGSMTVTWTTNTRWTIRPLIPGPGRYRFR